MEVFCDKWHFWLEIMNRIQGSSRFFFLLPAIQPCEGKIRYLKSWLWFDIYITVYSEIKKCLFACYNEKTSYIIFFLVYNPKKSKKKIIQKEKRLEISVDNDFNQIIHVSDRNMAVSLIIHSRHGLKLNRIFLLRQNKNQKF